MIKLMRAQPRDHQRVSCILEGEEVSLGEDSNSYFVMEGYKVVGFTRVKRHTITHLKVFEEVSKELVVAQLQVIHGDVHLGENTR